MYASLAASIARATIYSPLRYRDIVDKYGSDPDWKKMRKNLGNNKYRTPDVTDEILDSLVFDTKQWFEKIKNNSL
jgi:hypothetical protein